MLAGYGRGEGLLKTEVVENIVEVYKFDPLWLFKGQGEPFPGARVKYPEVCGPEIYTQKIKSPIVNESEVHYNKPAQIKISEDLTLATKVLESDTPYAVALHLNIRAFSRAVDAGERITQLESKVDILEKRLNNMVMDGTIKPGLSGGSNPDTGASEHQPSGRRKAM